MKAIAQQFAGRCYFAICLSVALAAMTQMALAQSADRERAQMLQMQQQLQRLQSDNTALQAQAKEAENLKKQSAQTSKELVKARAEAAAANRDIGALHAELDAFREETTAQIEQWRKAVEERDMALQNAATEKRQLDAQVALLSGRLKAQTGRADLCQIKHARAMQLGQEIVDTLARERLRLCEPVTGIWKVRAEEGIQDLRARLFELRLDVPEQEKAIEEGAGQANAVDKASGQNKAAQSGATATQAAEPKNVATRAPDAAQSRGEPSSEVEEAKAVQGERQQREAAPPAPMQDSAGDAPAR